MWTHNHLVCKWTLNHLAKLASCKSRCSHLNYKNHSQDIKVGKNMVSRVAKPLNENIACSEPL